MKVYEITCVNMREFLLYYALIYGEFDCGGLISFFLLNRRIILDRTDLFDGKQLVSASLTKRFGSYVANDGVDFSIRPGEIKALLGENGAGKSTFVKMLSGVIRPDSGQLYWDGKPVTITSPIDAKKLGIGMVFQHFSLFEGMTVLDNIALALTRPYNRATLINEIIDISGHYKLPVPPLALVSSVSVGVKQRIEILRCLMQRSKLLILDEPTSVLTPQEVESLFVTLRQLAEDGCAILYISHRLNEVRALCHSATIMRAGRHVAEINPREHSSQAIAELMLGKKIYTPLQDNNPNQQQPVYSVNSLNLAGQGTAVSLRDINFTINAGEIYAIIGLAGNGQNELMSVLSGEIPLHDANTICFNDKGIANLPISRRREAGIGISYVPEERLGHGAVSDMNLVENTLLTATTTQQLAKGGWLLTKKATTFAHKVMASYSIKAQSEKTLASELSGGNLQKFIVGREIEQAPKVILAAQPTWGVDVGAACQIQQTLIDLAKSGCAILVISQDLDEVFAIANRVSVIYDGQLSPSYPTSILTGKDIGLMMLGNPLSDDKILASHIQ
ncbi:ABC transporter ATP-binding protein [Ostreibacterium oceani]|nr:ABC transporter ATP-binding protein [Ostreibacterium oceani]